MAIRVFLLDDHQIVRRGVRELLESDRELQVVGEGGTAAAARRLLPGLCPDVAVLDVRLPDGSGIEVCRELRSTCPGSRALLLTSVDDEEALAAAVLAGASGYLLKGIRAIGLNEAVHAVASGAGLLPPGRVQRLQRAWTDPFPQDRALARLTPAERSVLEHAAHGRTNAQVAERLSLAEQEVRAHVSAILARLGLAAARATVGGDARARGPGAGT